MKLQRSFLFAYRLLLWLYPPAFRARFGTEMFDLAVNADRSEWPLVFGDTSIAIVRCWFEGTHSSVAVAETDTYLALGESSVSASRVLQGLALSVAIVVATAYISYRLQPPPCSNPVSSHPAASGESVSR